MIASRPSRRDPLLFVYGTLRPCMDIPMAQWLRRRAEYAGSAKIAARLYDLGRYPGLLRARRSGEWVAGDLFRIAEPRVLKTLDRYEGAGGRGPARFVRRRCTVIADGERRAAWVYVYCRSVLRRKRIAHGDYRVYRSSP